ncbi:MAG: UDP-N-acetylglucosamine 2-epimerase (non-hydrolyzing) [Kosmotoga sp.]|nr:MAG: UDP-N-acetylglucosamine 2-epimerase (non-hydrolyzing) [Kosmotoga sp.]
MKKIAMIFGTRPEAIKMAPVYLTLKESDFKPIIIATAQHREMLDQVLKLFDISPDYDLNIMRDKQTLSGLTSRLITSIDKIFKKEKFDATLVQGDTTSTFAGALVAFYHKCPVGHIEAGLRTNNIYSPFPEEVNRRLSSTIANYHFPPTNKARENLVNEGIPVESTLITGNTVIDALKWVINNKNYDMKRIREELGISDINYILLTTHRRESWGEPMRNIMKAVKDLLNKEKDLYVVFPVHLNPSVREIVFDELSKEERAILLDPLDYLPFVAVMEGSKIILTDSGGIQEEGPALGKPVLVLRETTERPEAIESGTAKLVGTSTRKIIYETTELLHDKNKYTLMARATNPFGDGNAAKRIVDFLQNKIV